MTTEKNKIDLHSMTDDQIADHIMNLDWQGASVLQGEELALFKAWLRSLGAERDLSAAVARARAAGSSWSAIGRTLRISGQAAHKRYARSNTGLSDKSA